MIQTIRIWQMSVVEPRTFASLPLQPANHTEFGTATTKLLVRNAQSPSHRIKSNVLPSHVITAFFQLYHISAVEATLPSFFLGLLQDLVGLFISSTGARAVPFVIAFAAYASMAATTSTHLAAVTVQPNLVRSDPSSASLTRAVNTVSSGELVELPVPCPLEIDIEQVLDVLKRDAIRRAASRRHLRRVLDGELEAALKA